MDGGTRPIRPSHAEESPVIGQNDLRELFRRLVTELPDDRELHADSIGDWLRYFNRDTGGLVSRFVEVLLAIESDDNVRESLLHAIAELAEWDLVPLDVISRTCEMCGTWNESWAIEQINYLRSIQPK